MSRSVLVTGAGGAIGGHLVKRLIEEGHSIIAVDKKPLRDWWQAFKDLPVLNLDCFDLSEKKPAQSACDGMDDVYHLAADMGGMGFISGNKLACMLSVVPTLNMLEAADKAGVERFFYASSACVYPGHLQAKLIDLNLKEEEAYPADPEDGYGWEKLFSERLCRHYGEETPMQTRVARYHNVYGPHGTWEGGREKAPAAICRKVAEAKIHGLPEIEVWGDGKQRRTFTYVDDCIEGTRRLMDSNCSEPLNIGSSAVISIEGLIRIVETIAGVKLKRCYVEGPQGVRSRGSDNTKCLEELKWEPSIDLLEGLEKTYKWIYDEISKRRIK